MNINKYTVTMMKPDMSTYDETVEAMGFSADGHWVTFYSSGTEVAAFSTTLVVSVKTIKEEEGS
jgi:hypothetical protein